MAGPTRGETFVIPGGADKGAAGAAPTVDFTTFLLGLASTALIHLGVAPHPEDKTLNQDLILARQSLDLLSMLREKTKGNLTAEEDRFFDNLLADLRLQYVEATKR